MTQPSEARDFATDELSDGEVVRRVLGGESARFATLVTRYELPLRRLAQSRGLVPELADEAVQETFLAAYRYLAGYDASYSFRTWLWTILLNQCKRLLVGQAKQQALANNSTQQDHPSSDPSLDPVRSAMQQEDRERLESLMQQLPEVLGEALRLRFFADATYPEIAECQGCCLATAKNRVRSALQWLNENWPQAQADSS